ncbi:MAG: sigma-70 family RNA polymerase sigma factor [Planctomycetota bacterium]
MKPDSTTAATSETLPSTGIESNTGPKGAREATPSPVARARSAATRRRSPRDAVRTDLWTRHARDCDVASRNALVEAYQGLVNDVVRRFAARLPRNVDRGDLITAANVGLMAAVTSFDPERGVPFEAYAERRIKGALLDELRVQDWLPRPWRQRIEQHKRAVERLRSELGRSPRDDEVAEALDIGLGDYQALFGTGFPGAPVGSAPVDDGDDDPFGALGIVPDTRGDAPDVRLTREELLNLVAQKLTEQEYRIVYLKYWEELPMREIGQLTGLSESRVCKIHARLIDRLQERLARLRSDDPEV